MTEEESQAEEPDVPDENATKKASEEEILAASRAADDDERTSRSPQGLVKKRRSGDEVTRVADKPPPSDLEPTRKAHDPELIAQSASRSSPSPPPSDLEPTRKAPDPTAESVRPQPVVSFLGAASAEPGSPELTEEEDDEDSSDLAETKVTPSASASDSFAPPSRPQSSPDPDRTGKLDGLPPFALLEKIEHIPADPDRTNEYVKGSGLADPAELDPGPLPPPSEPPPATSSPRPSPATETVQSQPPPSRRGFSAAALIVSNLIILAVGLVAGVALEPYLSLQTLEGPRTATIASGSNRPSPAENPPPAPQIPPPPAASSDAGRQAESTDGATSSSEPTTETAPVEPLQQIPDRMVFPMSFPPGEDEPASFDDETLRRIAEIIESSRTIRVELIGFASTSEGIGPALAHVVAEERAIAAEDQMRTYGLSRRRFASRAARPDEADAPDLTGGADGLLRPVILEVTQR